MIQKSVKTTNKTNSILDKCNQTRQEKGFAWGKGRFVSKNNLVVN